MHGRLFVIADYLSKLSGLVFKPEKARLRNTLPFSGIRTSLLQETTRLLRHGCVNFRAIGNGKIERDQAGADSSLGSCRRFFGFGRERLVLFKSLGPATPRQQQRTGGCA